MKSEPLRVTLETDGEGLPHLHSPSSHVSSNLTELLGQELHAGAADLRSRDCWCGCGCVVCVGSVLIDRGALAEEEDEVDSDTDAGKEQQAKEGSEEDPGDGDSQHGDHASHHKGEDSGCKGDNAAQKPAHERDPAQESDNGSKEEVEAKHGQEDAKGADELGSVGDHSLLLFEELSRGLFGIDGAIDDLFEQGGEALVDAEANVAVDETTSGAAVSVSALAVGHTNLVGVPLAEGRLAFLVDDLLGDDSGGAASVILEGNAVLANMRLFQ
uniref:Uncharacterized protein n=1 Tax=Favella ehrenbergii TaxID=182087 RepID=A0A7S3I2E8_9SPIT|mmetsp:Transcript_29211/g.36269  ORF Transcript_29211/g.36269 Transcript_29211/m.36269 type:complete len:271 (+) Transcript_29211:113-925(+)